MRWLSLGLLLLLVVLQYRLWLAEGSIAELHRLEAELENQRAVNEKQRVNNRALEVEVLELQSGTAALEERARQDLGMIKQGETFYLDAQARDDRPR